MRELLRICVFSGSSAGRDAAYRQSAVALGRLLADEGISIVYGGGSIGLMGILADEVLARGGEVEGVLPAGLFDREVAHEGLTRMHVVATMHERKALMYDLSDGFITLPGGLGTLDELLEITTWGQLGLHDKPIGLLDPVGYFRDLLRFLDRAVDERFLRPEHRGRVLHEGDPGTLLERMRTFTPPPPTTKWVADA